MGKSEECNEGKCAKEEKWGNLWGFLRKSEGNVEEKWEKIKKTEER